MNAPDLAQVNILGVGISAVNMQMALAVIDEWIAERTRHYVCVTPVHSVMECHYDPEVRALFNRAGLVTPDGMPVVWLCRLAGHDHVRRVYGPDLMLALCEHSQRHGYRHFFYGGTPDVLDKLCAVLQARFPDLQIAGSYAPPFRPLTADEDAEVVAQINASEADIVWVGLGAPKQERWMAEHRDKLAAPVQIGVGAAFDFHAGTKPQAPRWMQRSGLEWLFRLASEPRRLWKRYFKANSLFVLNIVLQKSGLRKFPL
jgi:N-acetylglucosaminyldiphosphoundecaprenol N-acetyl-beta-D-mannosaminyltransferase